MHAIISAAKIIRPASAAHAIFIARQLPRARGGHQTVFARAHGPAKILTKRAQEYRAASRARVGSGGGERRLLATAPTGTKTRGVGRSKTSRSLLRSVAGAFGVAAYIKSVAWNFSVATSSSYGFPVSEIGVRAVGRW
jgi:hypothetical protein